MTVKKKNRPQQKKKAAPPAPRPEKKAPAPKRSRTRIFRTGEGSLRVAGLKDGNVFIEIRSGNGQSMAHRLTRPQMQRCLVKAKKLVDSVSRFLVECQDLV